MAHRAYSKVHKFFLLSSFLLFLSFYLSRFFFILLLLHHIAYEIASSLRSSLSTVKKKEKGMTFHFDEIHFHHSELLYIYLFQT